MSPHAMDIQHPISYQEAVAEFHRRGGVIRIRGFQTSNTDDIETIFESNNWPVDKGPVVEESMDATHQVHYNYTGHVVTDIMQHTKDQIRAQIEERGGTVAEGADKRQMAIQLAELAGYKVGAEAVEEGAERGSENNHPKSEQGVPAGESPSLTAKVDANAADSSLSSEAPKEGAGAQTADPTTTGAMQPGPLGTAGLTEGATTAAETTKGSPPLQEGPKSPANGKGTDKPK